MESLTYRESSPPCIVPPHPSTANPSTSSFKVKPSTPTAIARQTAGKNKWKDIELKKKTPKDIDDSTNRNSSGKDRLEEKTSSLKAASPLPITTATASPSQIQALFPELKLPSSFGSRKERRSGVGLHDMLQSDDDVTWMSATQIKDFIKEMAEKEDAQDRFTSGHLSRHQRRSLLRGTF